MRPALFFGPFGLLFDPIGSDQALDARFDGEFLSGIYVSFVQFGAAAAAIRRIGDGLHNEAPLRSCMSGGRLISGFARGIPREYQVHRVVRVQLTEEI
jgi:hypothetical protein